MTKVSKRVYPENIEFSAFSNPIKKELDNGKNKSLERFCKRDLEEQQFKITEARTGVKKSISVYNLHGELIGEFNSFIKAHKYCFKNNQSSLITKQ